MKLDNVRITPEGNIEPVALPANARKGHSLEAMQSLVGGLIQVLHLDGGRIMLLDEEGLLKGLDLNPVASRLAGMGVVGPVVIIPGKYFR
jgi:hypothetical protein